MNGEHPFPPGSKTFKYKLDFYYQQSLLYLLTLLLYAGIRGTYTFDRLPTLVADPILYIIIFFVLLSFVVLLLNKTRDRKLVIAPEKIIFHNKFRNREIPLDNIEWFHVGRERSVQTAGRSQIVVFKMKNRRRLFRIRIGRYERDRDLYAEMQRLSERLPKGKRFTFGLQ